MIPQVGQPVQFMERGKPKAAMIVHVHDETWVALQVFFSNGSTEYRSHVEKSADPGWREIPESTPQKVSPWNGIGGLYGG